MILFIGSSDGLLFIGSFTCSYLQAPSCRAPIYRLLYMLLFTGSLLPGSYLQVHRFVSARSPIISLMLPEEPMSPAATTVRARRSAHTRARAQVHISRARAHARTSKRTRTNAHITTRTGARTHMSGGCSRPCTHTCTRALRCSRSRSPRPSARLPRPPVIAEPSPTKRALPFISRG